MLFLEECQRNNYGEDKKISNNEELESFLEYEKNIMMRYPQIENYEIWNEPNNIYTSEEDFYWY